LLNVFGVWTHQLTTRRLGVSSHFFFVGKKITLFDPLLAVIETTSPDSNQTSIQLPTIPLFSQLKPM